MKPAVIFPDPMLAALTVLRSAHFDVTFGTRLPDDFAPDDKPQLPYAVVRVDNVSTRYPVVEQATVRVSVWHNDDAAGLALAQRLRATLLAYPGDTDVRSFAVLTGPVPTSDPESGDPLSYFTVAARLRPTTL